MRLNLKALKWLLIKSKLIDNFQNECQTRILIAETLIKNMLIEI